MDESLDIFPSQSSTDSSLDVSIREIHKLFPEAVYCQFSRDKSLFVLFFDEFGWNLLRNKHRTCQISKENFVPCCTIPEDQFVKNVLDFELGYDPFEDDPRTTVLPAPVLCLISSDERHGIPLSSALFKQLFPQEVSLSANSSHPMYPCVIGLPDGRILFWHPSLGKMAELICHMYQPVVDIIAGPMKSLLCVGQQGKVICVLQGKERPQFPMAFVHGPVISCCYDGKYLYHTTTSYHLWKHTLSINDDRALTVIQTRLPVMNAKTVHIDSSLNKVQYISEDNILYSVPSDAASTEFASEHRKLRWLSDKISEQCARTLQLTELTEKYSFLLHDLTCAAWLLTPGKCGLKCEEEVVPVPGQPSVFNVCVTFRELGKLCPSGLWFVCCTVRQKLGSTQTSLTKTAPVCNDVVCINLSVPVSLGSKIKSWGHRLRPPLIVECSILFQGVKPNPLLTSRPCPAMKFTLQTFVLDEFSFLTEKGFHSAFHIDTVDGFITNLAKQNTKQHFERGLPISSTNKIQCSIRILAVSGEDAEDTVWQKILPRNLRCSGSKLFSLLGHDLKIWTSVGTENETKHISLFMETDSPPLLAGLRTAAIDRVGVSEQANIEITVSKEAMAKANALQSELQILKDSQSFDKVFQFYLKLRNEFSSNLMII